MLTQLVQSLVDSKNQAADDVLLEALRLGSEPEQALAINALLRRQSLRGLCGVISCYIDLPEALQLAVVQNVRTFHAALRECGRGKNPVAAVAAMKLIALGRQGKLTYILSEGLHGADESVSRAAVESIVALARWVATETRRMQRGGFGVQGSGCRENSQPRLPNPEPRTLNPEPSLYRQLIDERPEIEQAVARAMDVHRGRYSAELLRATLLLADSAQSRTLAILQTTKHGGQAAMVRRLQQGPDSEHVEAFLLGASHANLRSHFGVTFSHINEPPVLDALLRKTHWLKDQQLQLCLHQVSRGAWWGEAELARDLARRDLEDIPRIGEWIAASGAHDVMQDQRLERLLGELSNDLPGRLRLLRIVLRRPRGASVLLIRRFLGDPDERLVRIAAREIVRRRPAEFENMLIQLMTSAPESVRRVITRSVGQVGFDSFWDRFDRMDKGSRKAAGRAMMKLLPDGVQRLERRLRAGPVEQRMKAVAIVQELGVAEPLAQVLSQVCRDPNPRLRSKAVALLADLENVPAESLLETVLHDEDARVRSNAIEVLEAKRREDFLPLLTQRARSTHNRERANAIKALHSLRVGAAANQLVFMLQDDRAEHRISALWALRQVGWWQLLREVARLAKEDPNLRVRRYAIAILRSVSEMLEHRRKAAG